MLNAQRVPEYSNPVDRRGKVGTLKEYTQHELRMLNQPEYRQTISLIKEVIGIVKMKKQEIILDRLHYILRLCNILGIRFKEVFLAQLKVDNVTEKEFVSQVSNLEKGETIIDKKNGRELKSFILKMGLFETRSNSASILKI